MVIVIAQATWLSSGGEIKHGSLVTQTQKNMRLMLESAPPLTRIRVRFRLYMTFASHDVGAGQIGLRPSRRHPDYKKDMSL